MLNASGLQAGYGSGSGASLALPDLAVATGEHTLLLGPSGCGKTTLLNLVAGIALPVAGSITIDKVKITELSEVARDRFRGRRIGFVMQRLHLIAALTVEGNLALAQRLAGRAIDGDAIASILSSLGIGHKQKAYPRRLSQGEAQRVAIARAVINQPMLILADEPTAALDDANCAMAIDLLFGQAAATGATLLVATHDARIKPRFAKVVEMTTAPAMANAAANAAANL